jgi:hypothetical protein
MGRAPRHRKGPFTPLYIACRLEKNGLVKSAFRPRSERGGLRERRYFTTTRTPSLVMLS